MSDLDRKSADSEVFEEYLLFHQFTGGQEYRLDFMAIRIVGWDGRGGRGDPVIFEHVPEDEQNWDCTDPADADVFLEAEIKFDGEINLDFPNAPKCMLQFSGVHDATGIGRLIERMYAIAAERIPRRSEDKYFLPSVVGDANAAA